jgi:hypothetical protein
MVIMNLPRGSTKNSIRILLKKSKSLLKSYVETPRKGITMKTTKSLMALTGVIILFACQNKSNPAGPRDEFYVRISVKNANGTPVSGLRVSAWNKLAFGRRTVQKADFPMTPKMASTTIGFEIKSICQATLSVFDLNAHFARNLVDGTLAAGSHWVLFNNTDAQGHPLRSGVYKCRLTIKDTLTHATLFQDSVYAVLWQPEAEVSVLGFTAATGIYETQDSLWFPNLFKLPPLVATSESDPTPLGTFSISDTVTFVLTEMATRKQQTFERAVKKGPNEFEIIWNPSVIAASASLATRPPAVASPDSVQLLSFTASANDNDVTLQWSTALEIENLGFHLYRSTAASGDYDLINSELIPGHGTSSGPFSYFYYDPDLAPGQYYYKLASVSAGGKTTLHGPASVVVEAQVVLPTEWRLYQNYPNPFN